jgi:NADPH-dependent 2,4-dienoyl-CoA reductase/sulfur reductase-like enzyme
MSPILVVGASLAGLTATEALRNGGYDGELVVVDPSPQLPPDRPPLSKQVLAGAWEPDRAVHRSATRLPELGVDLRLGVAATSLDAATRTATLSDGSTVAAAGVVLAMGAAPRHLPDEPEGVHVLRTLEDCLALRAELEGGPSHVVVIGAGFIGAEVAATCRERGLDVTMIEAGPVPLGRVLPGDIGSFIAEVHREHGVDVRLGVGVDGLEADDTGRVCAVRMADGSSVPADVVVVGIGVVPSVGWLEGSGLVLDDGVRCDESCLAAPGIVAAGTSPAGPTRGSARSCASSSGRTRSSRASTRRVGCWPSWDLPSRPVRSRRSPGSGPTSTTGSCSSPAGPPGRTSCTSSRARSPSVVSSRCSGGVSAARACSA